MYPSLFGQPDSTYDFVKQNPVQAKQKFQQLNEKLSQMRKSTNTTVMTNLESVEKREEALKHMHKTVIKDKKKIEKTIESLDSYKLDALEKTWHVVDKDFGKIFGELLPGNTAKLVPLEGKPLTAGLQVKVNLGGVWKQSLTELSGGQRRVMACHSCWSLIALSLILSLLQFKPAPMYILDEIDAALDLSHTQNIGQLFQNRFKNSQFIVVSLKEGMFNNANVLFRAKFRNGISIVESPLPGQQPCNEITYPYFTPRRSAAPLLGADAATPQLPLQRPPFPVTQHLTRMHRILTSHRLAPRLRAVVRRPAGPTAHARQWISPLSTTAPLLLQAQFSTEGEKGIHDKLLEELEPTSLQVTDISVEIEAPAFKGKNTVQQHRLVNKVLKEELKHMHGLRIISRPPPPPPPPSE
ncbi:Structural maintenance of chromosomes protein 2 [Spiromyces aspiralis]|uniref:Structural maintenance of chromosomes protein 2 n=1 Tax=Spiromyces aspiralis TaxID=68401 RepID=A0ACC1HUW0_9FUNG|nr:Structural maintenance of chromosomes protein 2 [Spiromyces aspiralis]